MACIKICMCASVDQPPRTDGFGDELMSYQSGYNNGFNAAEGSASLSRILARQTEDAEVEQWRAYARQLEAKLAQAQAQIDAVRIQRNAYKSEAVKLSGQEEMTYLRRITHQLINPEMARNGLQMDAKGNVQRTR